MEEAIVYFLIACVAVLFLYGVLWLAIRADSAPCPTCGSKWHTEQVIGGGEGEWVCRSCNCWWDDDGLLGGG